MCYAPYSTDSQSARHRDCIDMSKLKSNGPPQPGLQLSYISSRHPRLLSRLCTVLGCLVDNATALLVLSVTLLGCRPRPARHLGAQARRMAQMAAQGVKRLSLAARAGQATRRPSQAPQAAQAGQAMQPPSQAPRAARAGRAMRQPSQAPQAAQAASKQAARLLAQ